MLLLVLLMLPPGTDSVGLWRGYNCTSTKNSFFRAITNLDPKFPASSAKIVRKCCDSVGWKTVMLLMLPPFVDAGAAVTECRLPSKWLQIVTAVPAVDPNSLGQKSSASAPPLVHQQQKL